MIRNTWSQRNGSLLLVSLWLITILSVLAVAIGRYLSLEIRVTKYRLAREQAKVLARNGVYVAMQQLQQDGADAAEPYDWLGDDWAAVPDVAVQTNAIHVQITDEERKLNLNGSPPNTPADALPRLLEQLGAGRAPELAQTIADYRNGPKEGEDKPEIPYFAKNGLFVAPEELNDLPDVTAALYEKLAPQLTAFITPPDATKPNLNTATPEVLSALGLSPGAVQAIEEFRKRPEREGVFKDDRSRPADVLVASLPANTLTTEDQNILNNQFGIASQTLQIVSEGVVEHPAVRYRVEAIVKRKDCAAGLPTPCIVAWKEG